MASGDIHIPADVLEAGARAAMRSVEAKHGSAEGRKLLGFDTLDAFIDAGWPNYVEQTRAAFLAMVKAWPGLREAKNGSSIYLEPHLILPLTEAPDV